MERSVLRLPITTFPSLSDFSSLTDIDKQLVYMAAYRQLKDGKVGRPEARKKLLKAYVDLARWDQELVDTMQAAARTPIHQK